MTYRILHCLRAPVGGLFRHVRDLTAEQAARGHKVGVICDARAGDELTERRLAAMSEHLALGLARLPMSRNAGPADVSAFAAVRDHGLARNVQIIHGHGAKGGAYARLAVRALKQSGRNVACFYTPHGGSLHYDPSSLKGRIYMAAERKLAHHSDGIIFESAYSSRIYNKNVGLAPCRTAIIPNGLLPEEFIQHTAMRGASDFLFVGELRVLKGVDILLHALRDVRRTYPATATIVGAGPDARSFRALSCDLGLADAVLFPGAIPAAEAFATGRALVMPSRAESFPYIVLEAGAAGIPLFASDVGGISEIVAGTDTALLPPDDAGVLAGAMKSFLADPAAGIASAQRLKAHIKDKFTVSNMACAIERFYDAGRPALTSG